MSKRDREAEDDSRPPKRPRPELPPRKIEEIHFARQLQDLLIFRQDGIAQLRNAIASFKAFLESILYRKDEDNRMRQVSILREYLETQKPPAGQDLERPFLSQLWQAWSFAVQDNNDSLISSVSALLALLLKTLSGILDLREHGALLCRTALQRQHVRLLKRSLDAPKHKEYVISPALRLSTEMACFDGGSLAKEVYKQRESTFDVAVLRRLLSMVKTNISEEEARRKPALRTLALRYVLSLLKYLHEGGKIDVLKSRPICGSLFQCIQDDPPEVITETLNTIEQSILRDSELPRSSKAAILTPQNLERVMNVVTQSDESHGAAERAFSWLQAVCSSPEYGVLRETGWYPPGTTKRDHDKADTTVDLGLDSLDFYDQVQPLNVRNSILLSWIQTLRPHVNERQRQLLLSCFAAGPELIAAYFWEKPMQLDPKLSNTWIGYASFLFEVISLPVPPQLDVDDVVPVLPPQTVLLIESVLPRPLTQIVLTRCLNQSSDLITFFALRILIVAFEKLRAILSQMRASLASSDRKLWVEAMDRLTYRFTKRCPNMKEVINVFRKTPDDEEHALQREAVSRLLRLYFEVTPAQAFQEQFDISIALTAALDRADGPRKQPSKVDSLRRLELDHLLSIARQSTGMKWFNKQGSLMYSPLTTLLRIYRHDMKERQTAELLERVFVEGFLLNRKGESTLPSPFNALVASTIRLSTESNVWQTLDDWLLRSSRKPVKYLDDLTKLAEGAQTDDNGSHPHLPSLFIAVVLEQTPFIKSQPDADQESLCAWVETLLALLSKSSDGGDILRSVSKTIRKLHGRKLPKVEKRDIDSLLLESKSAEQVVPPTAPNGTLPENPPGFALSYQIPSPDPESHPELMRWSQKDFDMAMEDGDIDSLILCLCSEHSDIRKQASVQLNKLKDQLRSTTDQDNHQQLSLLVGEVLETFQLHYLPQDARLPHIAGAFAVQALRILTLPQHFMYPKVNRFLIRGPEWRVHKLPAYWLSNIVLSCPEEDDAYWHETQWVLDWLVLGLRTAHDLDIFRRASVFEKTMALWSSPGAASRAKIRDRILELIFRATCIDGGCEMLVTRVGILSWLEMAQNVNDEGKCEALRSRILEVGNSDRINTWTGSA